MVARLTAAVPRFVLLPILAVLGTATLTFAADSRLSGSTPTTTSTTPSEPAVLVVPDVRKQAYVFAKGTLEDAGFAWRVAGSVRGYAANLVARQNPAPGTRVLDTGAPTIALTLSRNPKYAQKGVPENASPFPGTEIAIAGLPTRPKKVRPAAKPKRTPAPKPAPKKAVPKKTSKPAKVRPKQNSQKRSPAFRVAGAPKEPLDEMLLSERAKRLDRWLSRHPRRSRANVRHWLYQHAWIVTGSRFGWSHGEEALERLVRVDRRVQELWGVGARSERTARAALAFVRARS